MNFINKSRFTIILSILSVIGSITIFYITRFGSGISPDSIYYISGSRSIFAKLGYLDIYNKPMTDWPPLFSYIISLFTVFLNDPAEAARYFNSIIYGINISLVGTILYKLTNKSLIYSLLGTLLFAISLDMLMVHRMIWSEPFFITLTLLWVILYNEYLEKTKYIFLVFTALIGSLMFLQRYIGIYIYAVFFLDILIRKKYFLDKIKAISIYVAVSLIPILIWIIRNNIVAGTSLNKNFSLYSIVWTDICQLLSSLFQWLIPYQSLNLNAKIIIALFLTLSTTTLSVYLFYTSYKNQKNKLIQLLILIFYIYFGILIIFRIILNAESVFGYRFLAPIFPFFIFLWVYFIKSIISSKKIINYLSFRKLFLLMIIIYFTILIKQTIKWVHIQNDGYSFASVAWKNESVLLKISEKLDSNYKIYSNLPIMIYYYGGKRPFSIYDESFSKINFDNSIVILFNNINDLPMLLPLNIEGIRKMDIKEEGIIYCSNINYNKIFKMYNELIKNKQD